MPGHKWLFAGALTAAVLLAAAGTAMADAAQDKAAVAALDTTYQAAVKANDADKMAAILADDFVLVVGSGATQTKKDLIDGARAKAVVWEQQTEEPGTQTVRVWGDTAVVTAKLWLKGMQGSRAFDRKLWFSDTYVRTPTGWRYVFGQSSLALPPGR